MNHQEYLQLVKARFPAQAIRFEAPARFIAYEEVFKWAWLATKLKIMSFVTYAPSVDRALLERYSADCLAQAIREKRGLPRGFQSGVVSYSVVASENVAPDAVQIALSRPPKHFAAIETPVVLNLSNDALYCYRGEIVWGMVYQQFILDYMLKHFAPLYAPQW